jgi:phage/plasmid-associated DNA primase
MQGMALTSFQDALTSCGRMIALAPPERRLLVFQNSARELVGYVRQGGLEKADVIDRLAQAADAYGLVESIGLERVEAEIADAFADPIVADEIDALAGDHDDQPEKALAPEFSEEALARVFTSRHKDDLRYVNLWLRWLIWDGHRWRIEETLRALDLARAICREAAIQCGGGRSNKLASYATMHAVEMLARADRIHAAETGIWDANPWSLNTPGGSVDLKTGMIVPPRREDLNTKICAIAPGGECPLWQAFLATITGGDAELQAYLQRLAGYCLTGVTVEHAMFFFYGTGANGKTVFTPRSHPWKC